MNSFDLHVYQWVGGGSAKFAVNGRKIMADYVNRGGAPRGSGGAMFAKVLKQSGNARPSELFGPNVIQKANLGNSNAHIESTLRDTVDALGGNVTGVTRGVDAGKHWIRVSIGY